MNRFEVDYEWKIVLKLMKNAIFSPPYNFQASLPSPKKSKFRGRGGSRVRRRNELKFWLTDRRTILKLDIRFLIFYSKTLNFWSIFCSGTILKPGLFGTGTIFSGTNLGGTISDLGLFWTQDYFGRNHFGRDYFGQDYYGRDCFGWDYLVTQPNLYWVNLSANQNSQCTNLIFI